MFTELCWILWHRPRPFTPTAFSANSQNVANLLFRSPPRPFTNFYRTVRATSVDSPDKMLLKEFWYSKKKILNLLNNNFLYILLKTQSVAYLHSCLSEWHETQLTTSPWDPEALCKMLADDHYDQTPPTDWTPQTSNSLSIILTPWRWKVIKNCCLRQTCWVSWCGPFSCLAIKHRVLITSTYNFPCTPNSSHMYMILPWMPPCINTVSYP